MVTDWKKLMGKALGTLTCSRSEHEVWADFAVLGAYEIGQPLGLSRGLESDAARICEKYSEEEISTLGEMMGCTIAALDENPRQDFLGSSYMALGINGKSKGQFFTPYSVCEAMAEISITKDKCETALSEKGYIRLNDPACGGGATLIASANRLRALDVDYQGCAWFVGQDLNLETACMCYIQLSLIGCAGRVIVGDTLAMEKKVVLTLPMSMINPIWTARQLREVV